ncbi:MAG: hypothetical protein K8I02_06555 [Candidatus Methylomirabilis sp.]|nr:hypothetical protein [Deltaproteobacteria bacterium]
MNRLGGAAMVWAATAVVMWGGAAGAQTCANCGVKITECDGSNVSGATSLLDAREALVAAVGIPASLCAPAGFGDCDLNGVVGLLDARDMLIKAASPSSNVCAPSSGTVAVRVTTTETGVFGGEFTLQLPTGAELNTNCEDSLERRIVVQNVVPQEGSCVAPCSGACGTGETDDCKMAAANTGLGSSPQRVHVTVATTKDLSGSSVPLLHRGGVANVFVDLNDTLDTIDIGGEDCTAFPSGFSLTGAKVYGQDGEEITGATINYRIVPYKRGSAVSCP